MIGLFHHKEQRFARNHSLMNDSNVVKFVHGSTGIDPILSPKISVSKIGTIRYGSNIKVNNNNQESAKNLNYFGATDRGYRGSIIKIGKISPLSNRSRVEGNNLSAAIQQAGLSVLGSPVRVSLHNLDTINSIIPQVHTIDPIQNKLLRVQIKNKQEIALSGLSDQIYGGKNVMY